MDKIKILGIVGSLREGSYNKSLMNSALELVPKGAILEVADISQIPIFNQDLENGLPEPVIKFKKQIKESDAILFATPEYNYSIPGPLKNAIDWASRPYPDNSWDDKPVAVMSASGGMIGGARAQYHLRQTFVFLNMHPLNKPEVIVTFANEKIDENGMLTDEHTKKKIKELLDALVVWTKRLKK